MFAKKPATESNDAPTADQPAPAIVFTPLQKPGRLQIAERTLSKLRADREALTDQQRAAVAAAQAAGNYGSGHARGVAAVDADIKAINQKILEARADLAAVRADWLPTFRRHTAPTIAAAVDEIVAGLTAFEKGLDALKVVDMYGMRHGLEPQSIIRNLPYLRGHAKDIRRIIGKAKR